MSQKYIKSQNKNSHNAKSFGKYYAKPVYDEKFVETDEIADFIQTQATLKRSDIKAALDELGAAMKHFLEMGQKIRLAGIGIFKVGFSSIGVVKADDCTANTITSRRVLFQPETERIVVGSAEKNGKIFQKYVNAKSLLKDVAFEGGLDIRGQPADTRTAAQKQTMRRLLEELHGRYPRAVIVGHHDLNPHKDCPCIIDVAKEYWDLQPK